MRTSRIPAYAHLFPTCPTASMAEQASRAEMQQAHLQLLCKNAADQQAQAETDLQNVHSESHFPCLPCRPLPRSTYTCTPNMCPHVPSVAMELAMFREQAAMQVAMQSAKQAETEQMYLQLLCQKAAEVQQAQVDAELLAMEAVKIISGLRAELDVAVQAATLSATEAQQAQALVMVLTGKACSDAAAVYGLLLASGVPLSESAGLAGLDCLRLMVGGGHLRASLLGDAADRAEACLAASGPAGQALLQARAAARRESRESLLLDCEELARMEKSAGKVNSDEWTVHPTDWCCVSTMEISSI